MSESKPHSISVAEVAEMAYAHAKKAWWANARTDLGEPLGDYPAEKFNEGLEELKAAFSSLEEQLEAAHTALSRIDALVPDPERASLFQHKIRDITRAVLYPASTPDAQKGDEDA